MEKSDVKGLESKGCESSDASIRSPGILKENPQPPAKTGYHVVDLKKLFPPPETHRLYATGYDTCLDQDVVKEAVTKHFSSCGKAVHVIGPGKDQTGLTKTCLVCLSGEGAIEKALKLNVEGCNCDVDGCKIVVDKVLEEADFRAALFSGHGPCIKNYTKA